MTTLPEYAIIVAGGKGVRMGGDQPKQFMELGGLPIVLHTIKAFYRYSPQIRFILVLPQDHVARWETVSNEYALSIDVKVCAGGNSRTGSVRNGLAMIDTDGLVAIHDAVRPLVDTDIIAASYKSAREKGSGVVAVALKDSLRQVEEHESNTVDREHFRLVQTPQSFPVSTIKEAYNAFPDQSFSDDASVFEKAGYKVYLVNGSYRNFKITTKEDLILAQALLERA
ncbi:MAG: 2-C-methyl-D-erythritol 4-phosphate cytidylyltransferase [Cyclobacteriaceae bacterium]